MIGADGYYSLREILGYNAKYNVVLSDRGRGKSFAAKHFLMGQDGQFMCLYRQVPDMRMAVADWVKPLLSDDKKDLPVYSAGDLRMEGNGPGGNAVQQGQS